MRSATVGWISLRLFFSFPNGRAGAGLLLLRVLMGVVVVLHGVRDISTEIDPSWHRGVALVGAVGGALIVAGFLTPLAAVSVGSALALSWLLSTPGTLSGLDVLLLISQCAALALLGPGAWSLDAQLFGRREILIPRDSRRE